MKPTVRHYRSDPISKATSVVLVATICAFALSACNVRPPARQNTGSPPDALDCYRGVTTVPDTGTGLANFNQIHGGFSYWGACSEKIHQAGIPSFPLGMTGWTLPENKKPNWSFTRADGTVARNLACWNSPYKDHIVVHLLNGAVRQRGKTYPIGPATIKIRRDLTDGRVPFLVWPLQANLRAEKIEDTLEVCVPETEVHQIVVFERARTD